MNIRLYHPNSIVENTTKLLSKEHGHYVLNVMRLKLGSRINFFNKDEVKKIENEERELAQKLSDKYGRGSLDIETGTFTPAE